MMKIVAPIVLMALIISGCGGGGGGSDAQNTDSQSSTIISAKAQLGPLASADVKIYEINTDGSKTLLFSEVTSSDGTIEGTGNFESHADVLDANSFYLYEVSGGEDIDVNDDGIVDATATINTGTINALISGASISGLDSLKVTIVSEILYQIVKPNLLEGTSGLQASIDIALASIITSDIDGNGIISENDLYTYNPVTDEDALSDAYRDGKLQSYIDAVLEDEPIVLQLLAYDPIVATTNFPPVRLGKMELSKDKSKVLFTTGTVGLGFIELEDINNFQEGFIQEAGSNAIDFIQSNDEDSVYVSTASNGVKIISLRDENLSYDISVDNYAGQMIANADETILYTAAAGYGINIIDLQTKTSRQISTDLDYVKSVVLSKDENTLYIGDDARLHVFDLATETILESFDLNGEASRFSLSDNGNKLYISYSLEEIAVFDTQTKSLSILDTAESVYNIYFNEDKTRLMYTDGAYNFYTYNPEDGTHVLLLSGDKLDKDIEDAVLTDEYIYFHDGSDDVYAYDYKYEYPNLVVESYGSNDVLVSGVGLSSDESKLYTTYYTDEINIYSTDTQEVIDTISLSNKPSGILMDEANGYFYVSSSDKAIDKINILTHEVVVTPVNDYISRMKKLGDKIYMANRDENISIYDTNTQVIDSIAVDGSARDIVINKAGTRAYVATPYGNSGEIAIINLENNTLIEYIDGFNFPYAIVLSEDESTLYVGDDSKLYEIKFDNANAINLISNVSSITYTLRLSPSGKYAYLGGNGGIDMVEIDTGNTYLIFDDFANNFIFNADFTKMYIGNGNDGAQAVDISEFQ